ncbi:hypothetical protein BESB_035990 [Besnoitia besnoiti]|uniref:SANT domain-containing protein n=1 Tax=Besnoitia besnoiti TaxID=94643 RepID=A0A2A9MLE2_BESBE|nr:hypothetical protein BESB_035990 [Besnoitia besnoiti]PFH37141.1 hypothetical protein BESB_035990 [Besnoitia besnoiti]
MAGDTTAATPLPGDASSTSFSESFQQGEAPSCLHTNPDENRRAPVGSCSQPAEVPFEQRWRGESRLPQDADGLPDSDRQEGMGQPGAGGPECAGAAKRDTEERKRRRSVSGGDEVHPADSLSADSPSSAPPRGLLEAHAGPFSSRNSAETREAPDRDDAFLSESNERRREGSESADLAGSVGGPRELACMRRKGQGGTGSYETAASDSPLPAVPFQSTPPYAASETARQNEGGSAQASHSAQAEDTGRDWLRVPETAPSQSPTAHAGEAENELVKPSRRQCLTEGGVDDPRQDPGGATVLAAPDDSLSAEEGEQEPARLGRAAPSGNLGSEAGLDDASGACESATSPAPASPSPALSLPRARRGWRRGEASTSPRASEAASAGRCRDSARGADGGAPAAGDPPQILSSPCSHPCEGEKAAGATTASDEPDSDSSRLASKGGRGCEAVKPEMCANGVSLQDDTASPSGDPQTGESGVCKEPTTPDGNHTGAGGVPDRAHSCRTPVTAEHVGAAAEGVRGKMALESVNGNADGTMPTAKRRRHASRGTRQGNNASPFPCSSSSLSPSASSSSAAAPSSSVRAVKSESPHASQESSSSATGNEQVSWEADATGKPTPEKEQKDSRPFRQQVAVFEAAAPAAAAAAPAPSSAGSGAPASAPPASRSTREGSGVSSLGSAYAGSGMSTRKRRAQSAAAAAAAGAAADSADGALPAAESGGGLVGRDGVDAASPCQTMCAEAKSPSISVKKAACHGGGGAGDKGSGTGWGSTSASPSSGGASGNSGGDPVASPSAASADLGAAARFSARLRQRPGDARAALAAQAYHVLPVPSPYVASRVRCCCCGTGVGSSSVLLGGSLGLGPDLASAAHATGASSGSTGPEGMSTGSDQSSPSSHASSVSSHDSILILPRRISPTAYNNFEIRARYDICQRRIRKVEAWLQMIEEWYFGSAAPRWQSLHQQTVQQELVAAVNSTKRSRLVEAVRGGGDASTGLVEPPAAASSPPWASGTGKGSKDGGKGGGGSASGGGSSIYGIHADGGGILGINGIPGGGCYSFYGSSSGGGSGAGGFLSSRGSSSSSTGADSSACGVVREGRVNPEGGLATADSVIYALIISNNVDRNPLTCYGAHGAGGGGTGGGGTGGGGTGGGGGGADSGRGDTRDGVSSGGTSGVGGASGGGRKGDGGSSHATKNAAGGGKGSRGGGGGAAATPRLGAVKLTPLELLTSPLRKDNVIDLWGPKEVALFEAGICKYGKDFSALQRLIQTKTTCEIVDFYYLWKQTNRYIAWKQHRHLSKTILHSVFG